MAAPPPLRTVTVLGECVADAVTAPARTPAADLTLQVMAGGGPANTAATLARLGTPTRFSARLSHDLFGRMFRDRLTACGVDLTGSVTAIEPSTLAIADVDEKGRADYTFFADNAADWQWTRTELDAIPLDGTICVHTGSLALAHRPGGPHIEHFLARAREQATVCVDPNVRPLLVPPEYYRQRLAHWCALADIIRLSEDDLAVIFPDVAPDQACDLLHDAGAALVVITLGERGVLASLAGDRILVPAPNTAVVDTIGAGDSFTAGLLHRLANGGHLGGRLDTLTRSQVEAACSYAVQVAALVCSVPGPTLPPDAGRRLAR